MGNRIEFVNGINLRLHVPRFSHFLPYKKL